MASYNLINNSWAAQNSEVGEKALSSKGKKVELTGPDFDVPTLQLLNNRLKTEMKFQGFVMSDCESSIFRLSWAWTFTDWLTLIRSHSPFQGGGTHAGVASANSGLDMTMPGDIICCESRKFLRSWSRGNSQSNLSRCWPPSLLLSIKVTLEETPKSHSSEEIWRKLSAMDQLRWSAWTTWELVS